MSFLSLSLSLSQRYHNSEQSRTSSFPREGVLDGHELIMIIVIIIIIIINNQYHHYYILIISWRFSCWTRTLKVFLSILIFTLPQTNRAGKDLESYFFVHIPYLIMNISKLHKLVFSSDDRFCVFLCSSPFSSWYFCDSGDKFIMFPILIFKKPFPQEIIAVIMIMITFDNDNVNDNESDNDYQNAIYL